MTILRRVSQRWAVLVGVLVMVVQGEIYRMPLVLAVGWGVVAVGLAMVPYALLVGVRNSNRRAGR